MAAKSLIKFTYPLVSHPRIPALYHRQVGLALDVVTPDEEQFLLNLSRRKLRRQPFHPAHFDRVIAGYRESQCSHWRVGVDPVAAERDESKARTIFQRMYAALEQHASTRPVKWLPEHVLELDAASGAIGPHVDHVLASGPIVSALVLGGGDAVPVEFAHVDKPDEWNASVLVPPRSLYFQCDDLRYDFTHAVPKPPGRARISIMFRDTFDRSLVPERAMERHQRLQSQGMQQRQF
ncbi:hypothetical protein BC828DRAFT_397302 [Blastocladiella britannica]|nr:hypothetical protein BC828DRAFT_397302 [Blastocladiella britannica]